MPLLYVFSDGPRSAEVEPAVREVRAVLRAIDWCEVVLCERAENLGLGRSIRAGVASVFEKHGAAIIVEDDLISVPGTYAWVCAALRHYANDGRVMSVTGWTHPRVTPPDVGDRPYFDGRAECLYWGAWPRSWRGMDQDAQALIRACEAKGIDPWRYGADLPAQAAVELQRNIWAVRFLYLHLLRGGLCLRPPWSMVEHIGFDSQASNASVDTGWSNGPLRPCPPLPDRWPEPMEHPCCAALARKALGERPHQDGLTRRLVRRARHAAGNVLRRMGLRKDAPRL